MFVSHAPASLRPGHSRIPYHVAFIVAMICAIPESGVAQPVAGAAARGTTRDSVLQFTLDRQAHTVTVNDLLNATVLATVSVCPTATSGRLTADDVSFVVDCGTSPAVAVNTASFAVSPFGAAAPVRRARIASPRRNEVVMIGTIHSEHRTSQRYSTKVLHDLLREIRPDYVLTEIPPNRFAAAMHEFQRTGTITEPRVARFPEYVDVLFPMTREMAFTIIPTAGWTKSMDTYRNAALKRLSADPARRTEWNAYQLASSIADSIVKQRGSDDPYFINSAAYDSIQTDAHLPYNRYFNRDLGPGGWDNINVTHFGLINAALDAHRGEGKRFVITYGAGHREWFLRELRQRNDIVLREVAPFLDRIGARGMR